MAHWAEIDENNIVLRVIVTSNEEPDEGYQFLLDTFGGTWLKTSFNTFRGEHTQGGTPFRKNYAGVGYTYDPNLDAFIPPKPPTTTFSGAATVEWVFNEESCNWDIVN